MVVRILCAAALLSSLYAASVEAQTWDGGGVAGGSVTWNTGINWNPDGLPINNGTANIVMSGTIDTTNTVDVSYNINSLTFGGAAVPFVINNSGGATLTIRGGGITNNTGIQQTLTVPVNIGAGQNWNVPGGAGNLIIDGPLGQTGSGFTLNKVGTGTLRFSGGSANTYTGSINISQGTLLLSKTAGVNAIAGGFVTVGDVLRLAADDQISNSTFIIVNSSGLFDLAGFSETIGNLNLFGGNVTTGAGVLTLNGNISGGSSITSTITGNLNLAGVNRIFSVNDGAAAIDLDVAAAIAGGGASGGVNKTGTGTLQFSGGAANTYTGITLVNDGRLVLAKTASNGAILGDLIIGNGFGADEVEIAQPNQIASTANVTVNDGANLLVSAAEDGFGLLTLNDGGVTIGAVGSLTLVNDVAVNRGLGDPTIQINGLDRPLILSGTRTFTVNGGGDPVVDLSTSAAVQGGTLVKDGLGIMTLTGGVDNTASATINAGTLIAAKNLNVAAITGNIIIGDGAGGVDADVLRLNESNQIRQLATDTMTINSSGLLDLNSQLQTISNLILNGGRVSATNGVLFPALDITVNANAQTATIGATINLGEGSTDFAVADGIAAVDLDIAGAITDGAVNKIGAGTMRLANTADSTVAVVAGEGTLLLANSSGPAIAGSLDIGDGTGAPLADVVRFMADDQFAATVSAISVQSTGLLELNGFSDTVGDLFLTGGRITTGAGTLSLADTLTTFAHSQTASIDGNIDLGAAPRTFTVEDGAATIDLEITASITAETGGQLIKAGAGTLQLDGTVRAPVVLNAGTLTGLSTIGPTGSFTQNAGTFDGTLTNQGTFTYNGGTFSGQLINEGAATLGDDFTAGNGVINFGTFAFGVGQSLTTDGAGLDNQGSITLTSGTIDGNGPLVNNSLLSGRGTIAGSAGFANNGSVSVAGGNLSLSNSGANANTGLITVPFGLQLRLLGGNLTNTGTIDLDGGSASGTAVLVNEAGGIVQGGSSVQAPMTNNGGLVHANAGTTLIITNLSGGNINGGELRIENGSGINVASAFASAGTIVLLGADAQMIGGTITNTGTLRGSGRVSNSVLNSGTLLAEDGRLTLSGSGQTNTAIGIIEAHAGAEIFYSQGLATNAGQIALVGGRFDNNNRTLANSGSIAGDGVIRTGGLTNTGSIGVGGGDLDVIGPLTNNSTVSIQSGSTARFFGPVNGPGSYPGAGTAMFLNSFSPGASPAQVNFGGNLVLAGTASLIAELAGTTPGTQFDRLVVAGSASLAGALQVVLLDGFAPVAGNAFEIISAAAGVNGTFTSELLPALDANLEWNVLYGSNNVVLQVLSTALTGDYNLNGVVDAADYVIWRKTLGQTGAGLGADGNNNNGIDPGDYDVWRANFGRIAASGATGSASAAIPEPTLLALFIIFLAASTLTRAASRVR